MIRAVIYALLSMLAHQDVSSVQCAPQCFRDNEQTNSIGAGGGADHSSQARDEAENEGN